ncbi:ABC transporter permease [Pseudochryseolinea flava]|uniref:ABC transporter permease n=1 Tax=Pseudochryseolinea flava TaxID=2059302 RepID=A0A364Y2U6_9BACT|nr:ABC transporter permease [Pseudochryseolinea flava]RAW00300.1 hypothetical protein DQQ10_14695 [Pseudochryseolinea flava]
MFSNFFRTAYRNILKNKAYALINFIGLSAGISLALLIITYVRSEMNYDASHKNIDVLYRLKYKAPNDLELATTPPPIAPKLQAYFSDVENAGRMFGRNVSVSRPNANEVFEESDVFFADSAIAKMFTLEVVQGQNNNLLVHKNEILINEEMAKKYFGTDDPIGQTLIFSGKANFVVKAVVKNFADDSHIRFNMLVPYESMFDLEDDQAREAMRVNLDMNFVISHSYTYVQLKDGADPKTIDAGMPAFLKKYAKPEVLVGQIFTLMPVKDIHLHSELLAEPRATNSMTNIFIFIGVGFLTLLIASINYINLSTAQSLSRIKEIGIRKVLGSMKYQLIIQFLSESFLFCFVAMLLSYIVFFCTMPLMNTLTSKNLVFMAVVDTPLVLASLLLLLFITIVAGGYPAYFITQFESIGALKGGSTLGSGSQWLRKSLVVVQLTIACVLLCGAILIMRQMRFISNQPLGFSKAHVVNIPLFSDNLNGIFRQEDSTFFSRLQSYRDIIETQPNVNHTTLSSNAPGIGVVFQGVIPEGFTKEDNLFIADIAVDYDFINAYNMSLVAGRNFNRSFGTDHNEAFIVNETAVKDFKWGIPQQAIGKTINREGKIGKVIGVVRDFHFTSLTTPITSLVMEVNPAQFNTLSISFNNSDVSETIKRLEATWNELFPEKSFEFRFLDQQLNDQYQNFSNFSKIIQTFTGIAILISCLGVYGLVLYVVQRKVKEIGVRKVLGASVNSILTMICKDFAILIALGFVLAIPASWYLLNKWLQNFIYHVDLGVSTYLISFAIVLVIVLATISYQAIKASLANPVKALRTE